MEYENMNNTNRTTERFNVNSYGWNPWSDKQS